MIEKTRYSRQSCGLFLSNKAILKKSFLCLAKLTATLFFISNFPVQAHALDSYDIFEKVKDSVFLVKTLDAQGNVKSQGSGVLIPSGQIAVRCGMVEGGISYRAGRGEDLVPAAVFAEDADRDICLLQAAGLNGRPALFGNSAALKTGTELYFAGAADGMKISLSRWTVAQLHGGPPPIIQAAAAALSRDSGGGVLFDQEGRLAGLTAPYDKSAQDLDLAIPIEWISEVKKGDERISHVHSRAEWLRRACTLKNLKDYHGMLDLCRDWTKSDPQSALAWYFLGQAYTGVGHYDGALNSLKKSLRLNPKCAEAWSCLGVAYGKLEIYERAISSCRQALLIKPELVEAWLVIGSASAGLKRYADSIRAYCQALCIDPDNDLTWYSLGAIYGKLNHYEDEIESYRVALGINPKNASAWKSMAEACVLTGNTEAALEAVKELRRLDQEKAEKLFFLIKQKELSFSK